MPKHNATVERRDGNRTYTLTWTCTCGRRGGRYGNPKDAVNAKNQHLAANR